MTEVVIRNKKILNSLNGFKDELFSIEGYDHGLYWSLSSPDSGTKGKYYCSEEWLHHKLDNAESHSGFPEEFFSVQYKPVKEKHYSRPGQDELQKLRLKIRNDFTSDLGATQAALFSYYPPGGYVGWHTNWNNNAYQILFTWSESGNGYFKYYDKQKNEIITIQDVPGWQCRHYYFGRYDEPDYHCWHSAYTEGPRITLAYKFENEGVHRPADEIAKMLRDQLIEEIESED